MGFIRLLYRSDSELTGSDRAVREAAFAIAEDASVRNLADGVTGALMFAGGVFVQMLEGEAAAVEIVFERICRDMRQRRLVLLDFSSADERMFEGWGMVAFEGDERVRALFPTMGDATSFAHRNPMSANTAVQMMQALLAKRLSRPKRSGVNQLIATNIAPD